MVTQDGKPLVCTGLLQADCGLREAEKALGLWVSSLGVSGFCHRF